MRAETRITKGMRAQENQLCFCCGYTGHKRNDRQCPARGKKCRKCNGSGHFEAVCKTKEKQRSGRGAGGPRKPVIGNKGGAAHHVRQVETEGTQGDDFGNDDGSKQVSRLRWVSSRIL